MSEVEFTRHRPWFANEEEIRNSTATTLVFDSVTVDITEMPPLATSIILGNSPTVRFFCDCSNVVKVSCADKFRFDDANFKNLQYFTVFDVCGVRGNIEADSISINNKDVQVCIRNCRMSPNSLDSIIAHKIIFEDCDSIPSIAEGVQELDFIGSCVVHAFTTLPDSLMVITLPEICYSDTLHEVFHNHIRKMTYQGKNIMTVATTTDDDSFSKQDVIFVDDKRRQRAIQIALDQMPKSVAIYVQQFLQGSYLDTASPTRQYRGNGSRRKCRVVRNKRRSRKHNT